MIILKSKPIIEWKPGGYEIEIVDIKQVRPGVWEFKVDWVKPIKRPA